MVNSGIDPALQYRIWITFYFAEVCSYDRAGRPFSPLSPFCCAHTCFSVAFFYCLVPGCSKYFRSTSWSYIMLCLVPELMVHRFTATTEDRKDERPEV